MRVLGQTKLHSETPTSKQANVRYKAIGLKQIRKLSYFLLEKPSPLHWENELEPHFVSLGYHTASFRMWTPSSHPSVKANDSMKGQGGHFSWSSLFLTATSQCLSAERAVLWKGRGNLPSLYIPIDEWVIWETPEKHFDPKNNNTQKQRNTFVPPTLRSRTVHSRFETPRMLTLS